MTTTRPYNFSAGPATLPESVLLQAQAELLNWNKLGISVMEIGHRTAPFQDLMNDAESTLRELMSIPSNYHVLFLGGAARTQFAMVPLNCLNSNAKAGYLISGVWSAMAYTEAVKLKNAYCVNSSESSNYTTVPDFDPSLVSSNTAYLYYTPNETVNGNRFPTVPKSDGLPLIADMTSCILSEPINVSDYGLIFAGAQKNIAPAGLTLVIVRDDLLENTTDSNIPTMLDYRVHAKNSSLYATPPTFNCYMAGLMFHWLKEQGGVDAIYQYNLQKSSKLYQFIDESNFYTAPVAHIARSIVNVCFRLNNPELEDEFLRQAEANGLYGLKGHRMVGGCRASLYNAMPFSGVNALIDFMYKFQKSV